MFTDRTSTAEQIWMNKAISGHMPLSIFLFKCCCVAAGNSWTESGIVQAMIQLGILNKPAYVPVGTYSSV